MHHNARRLRQGPRHHLHTDPQVLCFTMLNQLNDDQLKVNYNRLGDFDKSFDFQSTVDRNINLQNLKRASAFIDIMDRHLDTVLNILPDRFCHIANTHIPGSPGLLELLQGRPGQGQDDQQQGDLQEVCAGDYVFKDLLIGMRLSGSEGRVWLQRRTMHISRWKLHLE